MYKYSAVERASNRRLTPSSDDNSYFYEDNDREGKMPGNNKGEASHPIANNNNNNNNKQKNNKWGVVALIDW